MLRRWWFWTLLTLVSTLCTVLALQGFPLAFPLVTMDLQMDRQGALAAARDLAARHGWVGKGFRQTAAFRLDSRVQRFVELEGGGNAAFQELLAGELLSPYTWEVRRFREGRTHEITLRFTPAGRPYGFCEKLAEDAPGASLDADAARSIAEQAATGSWQVDLELYKLVERSQEVRPGGRVDHSFVYERTAERLGDGRLRLRLVVSGDRLSELTHSLKVPEAFSRRYEEMRSANESIANGALIIVILLYLAGGCATSLFFLLRQRWVIWKPAVVWAVAIALLQAGASLNRWPLLWMRYDTAVSASSFIFQQLAMIFLQLVSTALLLSVAFMAAESLTRKAFPEHIQLWRSWSPAVASSPAMLGRTVAGYLLVGVLFAYEVVLYYLANRHLGWWTPSDALFDPNLLATYLPWLSAITVSLQAGFLEECLLRAVPLACAAILGERFGGRKGWIVTVLILQAVIFGAGHANYPAQPSYARLLELTIPALCFGGIYLAWGLLPAVVLHFVYDVVWFAIPLFADSSPGAWINQTLVVVLTTVPLLLVMSGRLRQGSWGPVPEQAYNRDWFPRPLTITMELPKAQQASAGLPDEIRRPVLIAGAAGLGLWLLAADFTSNAPPIPITRLHATLVANQTLAARGFQLTDDWRELSMVEARLSDEHRYIWQQGGKQLHGELLGSYLEPPHWLVRLARFSGDVAERAEELRLQVAGDATVVRFVHQLPENRPGAYLDAGEARALAHATIRALYNLDPASLQEISAEPSQQPQRRDWKLVFSVPGQLPLEQGEARIAVSLAGDILCDAYRFIHVPQEWQRRERNRASTCRVVQLLCRAATALLYLAGAVLAIVRWSRGRFALGSFALGAVLLTGMGFFMLGNSWPLLTAQLSTAQPFLLQVIMQAGVRAMALLVIAAVCSLALGLVHHWLPPQPSRLGLSGITCGLAVGVVVAGLATASTAVFPSTAPSWVSYDAAAAYLPVLGVALDTVNGWLAGTILLLLGMSIVHAVTRAWSRWQGPALSLLVLLGLVLAGTRQVDTVLLWLVSGVLLGALLAAAYVLVLRHHPALLLPATAALAILQTIRIGLVNAYPGALAGALLGVTLIVILTMLWLRRLGNDTRTAEA